MSVTRTVQFSGNCCRIGAFGGAKPIAGLLFACKPLLLDATDRSEEDFCNSHVRILPWKGKSSATSVRQWQQVRRMITRTYGGAVAVFAVTIAQHKHKAELGEQPQGLVLLKAFPSDQAGLQRTCASVKRDVAGQPKWSCALTVQVCIGMMCNVPVDTVLDG